MISFTCVSICACCLSSSAGFASTISASMAGLVFRTFFRRGSKLNSQSLNRLNGDFCNCSSIAFCVSNICFITSNNSVDSTALVVDADMVPVPEA